MDILRLLLPVIHALTATLVGMLLYKSSEAVISWLYKNKDPNSQEVKSARFAGSAAIAMVAFFGMAHYTPKPNGPTLEQLSRDVVDAQRAVGDIQLKLSSGDVPGALGAVNRLESIQNQVKHAIDNIN